MIFFLFLISCATQPMYDVSCFDKDNSLVYGGECFFPVTYQGTYYCYDNSGPKREKQVFITIPQDGRCVILPKDQRGLTE